MADRRVFHNSVVPIPVQAGLTPNGMMVNAVSDDHKKEKVTVHFGLELPSQARLEAAVANGQRIPRDTLAKDYGSSKADADSLEKWLKKEGFEITERSADHSSIYATAPWTQVEKSLQVDTVRVTKGGFTHTAARNAPSLPADVASAVISIGGLQPFLQAHKHARMRSPRNGNRVSKDHLVDPTVHPGPNIENAPPYLVSEIKKAYGADGGAVSGIAGKGQVIAILIDTFPDDSDLRVFWKKNGIHPEPTVQKINVTGNHLPPPSGEETLDVEWSGGIAPAATIRVYATGSLQFVDLDRALDRILADAVSIGGLNQLSISLGLGETYLNGPDGEVAVEHQKFLKLAAAGVNVFVSTGDAGSNPDETGHSSGGPLQVEYESSDPCVVAVGGTSLVLAPDGSVAQETGWTNGGGGKSIYFDRPAWQQSPGISGTSRLVPDVAAAADPETGAFVVLHGRIVQYGGTSWSAPMWAGFCALINEARTKAALAPVGFLNPLIYPLQGRSFRDIVKGSNGSYHAQKGYDLVTGLGTPNIATLVTALTSAGAGAA